MHFSQAYWQFAEYAFQPRISAVCCTCISVNGIGSLLNIYFIKGFWQFAEHLFHRKILAVYRACISTNGIDSLLNKKPRILAFFCTCTVFKDIGSLLNIDFRKGY
jgi:hypothetical protein